MAAAGDEKLCRFKRNKCKKVRCDNDLQFCQKHYNLHINFFRNNPSIIKKRYHHLYESETLDLTKNNKEEEEMKNQQRSSILPPDEQRCCMNDGVEWRCKNFRMIKSFGADDNYKYCEKHFNMRQQRKKKRSRDDADEFDDCNSDIETRDSKCLKLRRKQEDDLTGGIQPSANHTSSDRIVGGGSAKIGAKTKKVERTERSGELKSSSGISEPVVETRDSKCLKRTKKQQLTEEDDRTGGIQSPTNHTSSDGIVGGGSTNIGTTRKEVETTSGELTSLTGIREPVIEMESLEHYKTKCIELSVELQKNKVEIEKMKLELEKKNLELDKKNVECTELQGNYEKKELELEKNKVELEKQKEELEKQKVEVEKKNVECTILQGKYAELEIRKTAAKDEDAVKYWKSKCSDLESLVQRMEIENSTLRCEASRLSNLESLVPRNGNESSIFGCEELCNSEKIEAEARGLQNEITQSGESCGGMEDSHVCGFKTKENVLNAYDVGVNKRHDSLSEFPIYSAMNISSGSLHLPSGGENVEERKGWGSSEERPSQHGSSSQVHLDISKEPFANSVSDDGGESLGSSEERPSQHGSSSQDHLDISKEPFANSVSDDGGESLGNSEDSDGSVDSKNSHRDLMDMLAMKYRNVNDEKGMKWKSEPELLSSFEEDPELCVKAVCALYRQEISEDEISPKGLYIHSDTLRCTTLAKFLMDEDCKGDLKKSVTELETLDSKAVDDCKKLARRYSMHLFDIYRNRRDPFFRPATTASHGD
ncbi:hypothetical protein C5167_040875 [Papaver somniferum]|uniref:WRC domain-containing protein n=1 Tax=Papaver somniferum TaxID=3469 RepID=A0A4Y7IIM7_PAPSO|nr:nuclear-pore anchor-like isoform X2 [Papaver somniferum]RZC47936.1 hypothetical protein C5167_040875 [Papaver somniferum]